MPCFSFFKLDHSFSKEQSPLPRSCGYLTTLNLAVLKVKPRAHTLVDSFVERSVPFVLSFSLFDSLKKSSLHLIFQGGIRITLLVENCAVFRSRNTSCHTDTVCELKNTKEEIRGATILFIIQKEETLSEDLVGTFKEPSKLHQETSSGTTLSYQQTNL